MQTLKAIAHKTLTLFLYGTAIVLGTLLAFLQTQTRKEASAPLIQELSFSDTAHADVPSTASTSSGSTSSSSSTASSASTGSSTG